jgi:hypothetical protein
MRSKSDIVENFECSAIAQGCRKVRGEGEGRGEGLVRCLKEGQARTCGRRRSCPGANRRCWGERDEPAEKFDRRGAKASEGANGVSGNVGRAMKGNFRKLTAGSTAKEGWGG